MRRAPPDRSALPTEARNPRTMNLHRLSVAEIVQTMNREDRAVFDAMHHARGAIAAFIEAVEPGFEAGGRLVYVGAGTSGRIGVLDASEAPSTFQVDPGRIVGIVAGGDRALRVSSEGLEDDANGAEADLEMLHLGVNDAVLGIAAGGTTPYVLGALSIVKRISPASITGLLVCTACPQKPSDADHIILIETGAEVLTGSTRLKAGTATKLALNIISTALMIRSGRVYENLMVDLRATSDKLRDRGARIISVLTGIDRETSLELLTLAGGSVKAAVLMVKLGVGLQAAEELLSKCGGSLGAALGE